MIRKGPQRAQSTTDAEGVVSAFGWQLTVGNGDCLSDLLQPLHFVHTRNLTESNDDRLEMFEVGNV